MNQGESDLQNVIDELEAEQSLEKIAAVRVFRSLLNQPDFLAVNSIDKVNTDSTLGFDSFRINLPRPILEADSIQLVSATVPTATQNIPDTALVFWYYRLSAYKGELPSIQNLHFVRLLPSYYKKEFIPNSDSYGYNQTFQDYDALSDELAKACKQDLGNTNWQNQNNTIQEKLLIDSQYRPYDISVSYNEKTNKFQMQGLNAYEPPAFKEYDSSVAYVKNQKVFAEKDGFDVSFTCIQDAPINTEPEDSPLFWIEDNGDLIFDWEADIIYGVNRIVKFGDNLYICIAEADNETPLNVAFWEEVPTDGTFVWNRYLIAGFKDENVAKLQGRMLRPWTANYLFEITEVVEYNGAYWAALQQNVGQEPDPSVTFWEIVSEPIVSCKSQGNIITVSCNPGIFNADDIGSTFYISQTSNPFFNVYPDDTFITNANIYKLLSVSVANQEVVLENNRNFSTETPALSTIGGILSKNIPPYIGLSALAGQFDFVFNQIGDIPSQPFNPKPNRLLNSILGFTWNGIFNESDFPPDYTQNQPFSLRNVDLVLLNKTRPVPYYTIVPSIQGLFSAVNPQRSVIYTADGYCNLVYSSSVQVYASIVQGSTLNTTTSTGLLGSVMLNAKNLGIAFFQEGFSAPLSIYGSDIYSLTIQLKDDMNEPYRLANNAVMVMVLKISYK